MTLDTAWGAVDDDRVNDEENASAFVGRKLQRNLKVNALEDRHIGCAHAYSSANTSLELPEFSTHPAVARSIPFAWRPTPGASTLSVTLQYTLADAEMDVALQVESSDITWSALLTSGSVASATVTATLPPVPAHGFYRCAILFKSQSDAVAALTLQIVGHASNAMVYANATVGSWPVGSRLRAHYLLNFTSLNLGSTVNERQPDVYHAYKLTQLDTSITAWERELHIWPLLPPSMMVNPPELISEAGASGKVDNATLETLATMTLYGWHVYASGSLSTLAQASIPTAEPLFAGRLIRARSVRELDRLNRQLYDQRSRVYCVGPARTPGDHYHHGCTIDSASGSDITFCRTMVERRADTRGLRVIFGWTDTGQATGTARISVTATFQKQDSSTGWANTSPAVSETHTFTKPSTLPQPHLQRRERETQATWNAALESQVNGGSDLIGEGEHTDGIHWETFDILWPTDGGISIGDWLKFAITGHNGRIDRASRTFATTWKVLACTVWEIG